MQIYATTKWRAKAKHNGNLISRNPYNPPINFWPRSLVETHHVVQFWKSGIRRYPRPIWYPSSDFILTKKQTNKS